MKTEKIYPGSDSVSETFSHGESSQHPLSIFIPKSGSEIRMILADGFHDTVLQDHCQADMLMQQLNADDI